MSEMLELIERKTRRSARRSEGRRVNRVHEKAGNRSVICLSVVGGSIAKDGSGGNYLIPQDVHGRIAGSTHIAAPIGKHGPRWSEARPWKPGERRSPLPKGRKRRPSCARKPVEDYIPPPKGEIQVPEEIYIVEGEGFWVTTVSVSRESALAPPEVTISIQNGEWGVFYGHPNEEIEHVTDEEKVIAEVLRTRVLAQLPTHLQITLASRPQGSPE